MWGTRFAVSHLLPILLVTFVVLFASSLWAQATLILNNTSVRFVDHAIQLSLIPEYKTDPHLVSEGPRLGGANQGQSELRLRFLAPRPYYNPLIENDNVSQLRRSSATPELLRKSGYINSGAPSKWVAPVYPMTKYQTIHRADSLRYYSRHVPGADPIILRLRQQGEAHRRVTDVLKLFQPRF
jgi:hypothetical protein